MSENNGQANGSERLATPAPTATTAPGNGAARERIRVELNPREGVPNEAPPKAPAVPVIDQRLGENDVKVSISVNIHGRTLIVMDACEFNTTIYEGCQGQSRGRFFQAIERVLQEVRETIAIKFNTTVPIPDMPPKDRRTTNGEDILVKEPIPPWPAEKDAVEFLLHTPPELDGGENPGMPGMGPRR